MRVPTVFTAIDRFSSVVDKMTAKTTRFGASASAAAMRTSQRFNSAGTSMLTAGTVMAGGIGLAVNEAMKFEKSMSSVSTLLDSTPESMKAMGNEVLALSKIIPVAISDLTESLYDVVSAGVAASKSMYVLKASGRLAVAGLGTTKQSVDILTSSINAFGEKAENSEAIANKFMKAVKYGKTTVSEFSESFGKNAALMKNSNVSLDDYIASATALTTAGMSASIAQTQVTSAVVAMIKPNKNMQKLFSSLGVKDIPLFIKKNGSLSNSFGIITKKAKEMGMTLPDVFARKEGLSGVMSLQGELANKYNEILLDIKNNQNDLLGSAFQKQAKTAAAQFQLLKNSITTTAIQIGNVLLPRVLGFFQTLAPIVEKIGNWADKNEWLVNTLGTATITLLAFGAAAKIGAVLFYGLSKGIAIVSAITKAYTFISTMAALSNVSLTTATLSATSAMGSFVAAELAALAPMAIVVGALGVLALAYKMVSDATRKTMYTNVDSYKKSDASIKYSTVVMQSEFDKQYNLMVNQKNRVDILNGIATNVGNIGKKNEYYNMNTPFVSSKVSKTPFQDIYKRRNNGFDVNTQSLKDYSSMLPSLGGGADSRNIVRQENLAGGSNIKYSLPHIGGELKITVDSKDGSKAEVDDSQVKGITVHNTSTKKSSKGN